MKLNLNSPNFHYNLESSLADTRQINTRNYSQADNSYFIKMKYCSTRGGEKNLTFEQILFKGYAQDGGLYMPQDIRRLSEKELKDWSKLSYSEIVKQILTFFIDQDELPSADASELVDKAHSSFTTPNIIEIANLKQGLNVAELFHGETLAFKDLALSVVGQLLKYFLNKNKRNVIILVGTSGDTGSAVIHSVRGLDGIDVVVLYPKGKCTEIQELQMTTVLDDNVHCFAVSGSSDNLDLPIKQCFLDIPFAEKYNLISLNSINWGRIMIQIAHYFYIYFQLSESNEGTNQIEFVVPCGAIGNLTAGYIARVMGLPISLVSCTNSNKNVSEFINTGNLFSMDQSIPTLAPAMDINFAYNLERFFYLLTDNFDDAKKFGESFSQKRNFTLPEKYLEKLKSVVVDAKSYSDLNIKDTINKCWVENGYKICPHTATGVAYHYEKKDERSCVKRVCLATASADKFPEALKESLVKPNKNNSLENLKLLQTKYELMELGQDWLQILKEKIIKIHQSKK